MENDELGSKLFQVLEDLVMDEDYRLLVGNISDENSAYDFFELGLDEARKVIVSYFSEFLISSGFAHEHGSFVSGNHTYIDDKGLLVRDALCRFFYLDTFQNKYQGPYKSLLDCIVAFGDHKRDKGI